MGIKTSFHPLGVTGSYPEVKPTRISTNSLTWTYSLPVNTMIYDSLRSRYYVGSTIYNGFLYNSQSYYSSSIDSATAWTNAGANTETIDMITNNNMYKLTTSTTSTLIHQATGSSTTYSTVMTNTTVKSAVIRSPVMTETSAGGKILVAYAWNVSSSTYYAFKTGNGTAWTATSTGTAVPFSISSYAPFHYLKGVGTLMYYQYAYVKIGRLPGTALTGNPIITSGNTLFDGESNKLNVSSNSRIYNHNGDYLLAGYNKAMYKSTDGINFIKLWEGWDNNDSNGFRPFDVANGIWCFCGGINFIYLININTGNWIKYKINNSYNTQLNTLYGVFNNKVLLKESSGYMYTIPVSQFTIIPE